MYVKCVLRWRWGFAKSRPGCASRRREGGRAASEVDHHARPLAARWRGRNERGERGRNEPMGHFRRDFSKGLPKGLLKGPKHYCVFKGLSFGCLWYSLRETCDMFWSHQLPGVPSSLEVIRSLPVCLFLVNTVPSGPMGKKKKKKRPEVWCEVTSEVKP